MTNAVLVDRLALRDNLGGIPRDELEWLVANGQLKVFDAGRVNVLIGSGPSSPAPLRSGRSRGRTPPGYRMVSRRCQLNVALFQDDSTTRR